MESGLNARKGVLAAKTQKVCYGCSVSFTPTYGAEKYCLECRSSRAQKHRKPRDSKVCICGKTFVPTHPLSISCSPECSRRRAIGIVTGKKLPVAFGERLKLVIQESGMTQHQAAKCLGVSVSLLEAWIAGPRASWGRVPHKLMQIGAMQLMRATIGGSRVTANKSPWRITCRDGSVVVTTNLRGWLKSMGFPDGARMSLSAGREYRGYSAKRVIEPENKS